MDAIEKILSYKSWSDKRKIDELLRLDTYQYPNLGTDSPKTEKALAKKNSRLIYRTIRDKFSIEYYGIWSKEMGESFLNAMDKK